MCEKPKEDSLLFDSKFWFAILADDQIYPGRSFVTLKRHCGDLAELTRDELLEFHNMLRKFEAALKTSFNATLFNWTCLMNHGFKEKPYNPHVHWHVRPRYDHEVIIGDEHFTDEKFGSHYARDTGRTVSQSLKSHIVTTIRKNFK